MPTPPVHHPREVNYETRVRVGLAVTAAGALLPLTADRVRGGRFAALFAVGLSRELTIPLRVPVETGGEWFTGNRKAGEGEELARPDGPRVERAVAVTWPSAVLPAST